MLALPSWSVDQVEVPDLEFEFEKPKEEGKIKGQERDFTCKEQKEDFSSKLKETKERLQEQPKAKESQKNTLSARVIKATVKEQQQPLAKRAENSMTRSLPRHLPPSKEKAPLPRPFQPIPQKSQTREAVKTPLPQQKTAERSLMRENSRHSQRSEILGQAHQDVEVRVRDCLDQDEEKKRNWTHEIEDDLRGSAVIVAQAPVQAKERSYKQILNSPDKPLLVRPRMGIYALYYILTKIGLISDSRSHFDAKQQIRINREETDKTHVERLAEMKMAIDEEKSTKRWGVATQVFSWFTSFMGIMTGIALIMTGVGAVAGALLLCAGLIMVTNQLMQLTGAWEKIAEALPGDPEKKRSTIMWMQLGITVLCFLLSGAGVVFGGFSAVKQAMEASQMVMGGVIMMGYGTTSFGEGVSNYKHRNRMAKIRQHQLKLAELKHRREDLQEMIEASMTRLEQLFEDLTRLLEFETELFRADQRVNR